MPRILVLAALASVAAPAAAQLDPTIHAQGMVLQGTMQGHADRDYARRRGETPKPALSAECARLWKLHDRMTSAQQVKLYDLCPR